MIDDSLEPGAVSSFKDPDSGALPLTSSTTQSPPNQETPPDCPTTPPPPKSEVAQLFELLVAKMAPMEREM
jgi:hypothetical protein